MKMIKTGARLGERERGRRRSADGGTLEMHTMYWTGWTASVSDSGDNQRSSLSSETSMATDGAGTVNKRMIL